MNICYIGDSLNTFSGSFKPIINIFEEISKKGHKIELITSQSNYVPSNQNIRLHIIPNLWRVLIGPNYNTIENKKIQHLIKDCDIIHGIDFLSLFLVSNLMKRMHTRIPVIFTISGKYSIFATDFIHSGLLSWVNVVKYQYFIKLFTPNFMIKNILLNFDQIISTSDFMTNKLKGMKISETKIKRINVGLKIPDGYPKDDENDHQTQKRFFYYGWGSNIRGLQDVIDAFDLTVKIEPTSIIHYCLLGKHGLEETILVNKIRRQPNPSIILEIGFKKDISEIIQSSAMIVLPFRSSFGYSQPPLTILESMALKKPVISTHVGCIPEIITDHHNGFLVAPRNVPELAYKMSFINDDDLLKRIGSNAYNYILKNHNIETVTMETLDCYKNACEDRHAS